MGRKLLHSQQQRTLGRPPYRLHDLNGSIQRRPEGLQNQIARFKNPAGVGNRWRIPQPELPEYGVDILCQLPCCFLIQPNCGCVSLSGRFQQNPLDGCGLLSGGCVHIPHQVVQLIVILQPQTRFHQRVKSAAGNSPVALLGKQLECTPTQPVAGALV